MAIAFKKYERKDSELKELGTVKSLAGKGGKVAFIKKNFTSKRLNKSGNRIAVALILTRKNGESAIVPCSQQVSELVREGEITLNQLLGFPIIETERENDETGKQELVHLITLPAGSTAQEFAVDDQEVEEFENSSDYLPESFVTV